MKKQKAHGQSILVIAFRAPIKAIEIPSLSSNRTNAEIQIVEGQKYLHQNNANSAASADQRQFPRNAPEIGKTAPGSKLRAK
jgi:hypothetical protein